MIEDEFGVTDSFIRARQYDPKDFDKDSFKTIRLGNGVKAIIGKMLGDNRLTAQSIIFNKERFDEATARSWLSRNLNKISDAIELENKKVGLFEDMTLDQHMAGHLPPLTEYQIARLMALAGPAEPDDGSEVPEEDDEDEDDMQNHEDAIMAGLVSKYFKRL